MTQAPHREPSLPARIGQRLRPLEIPINVVGFVGLTYYLVLTNQVPATPSLYVMLGTFSIWTETALLERRWNVLSRAFTRKARADDPLPFAGAILGVVAAALAARPDGAARGVAVPIAMIGGAFLASFLTGLDWRRAILSAILVVYNGTGGAILRTAMTLAVFGNILRAQGT